MTEDERLDEQTAGAFGIASFYLMQALVSALIEKGALTMREAAMICDAATKNADDAVPISPVPEMQALAVKCLATVAAKWTRQAKGN
jgi:hypothetical protein